jgi:hypothetical protein
MPDSISEISIDVSYCSVRDKSGDIADGDITDIHHHLGGHHKVSAKLII